MRHVHQSNSFLRYLGPLALLIGALVFSACQQEPTRATTAPSDTAAKNAGKIPVTTSSEEARKEYLAGRDLQEKLRITDSIAHYDKALSLDPNNLGVRIDYADALLKFGDKKSAAEQYRRALTTNDGYDKTEPKRLTPERAQQIDETIKSLSS